MLPLNYGKRKKIRYFIKIMKKFLFIVSLIIFISSCGQSPEVEVYSTRLHPGMDLGISLYNIIPMAVTAPRGLLVNVESSSTLIAVRLDEEPSIVEVVGSNARGKIRTANFLKVEANGRGL